MFLQTWTWTWNLRTWTWTWHLWTWTWTLGLNELKLNGLLLAQYCIQATQDFETWTRTWTCGLGLGFWWLTTSLSVVKRNVIWLQGPCQVTDSHTVVQTGPQLYLHHLSRNHARLWRTPNSCRACRSQRTSITINQVWHVIVLYTNFNTVEFHR